MASFNVPINDDDILENDEDFTLSIRSNNVLEAFQVVLKAWSHLINTAKAP